MALHKYKIAADSGMTKDMVIEAESRDESLTRLRAKGFVPVKYCGTETSGKSLPSLRSFRDRFNVYEFTDRLAPLLKSHIPIEYALRIIAESMENEENRQIVIDIRRGLHEGKNFSELVRNHGPRFPKLYANLLEAGEKTGCIPEVVAELQKFLNSGRETRDFLITCSIYPVIVLAITGMVILLLFTVFIPRFATVFQEMGRELPLPTRMMMFVSNLLTGFWWLWLILLALAAAGIAQLFQRPAGKYWVAGKMLALPVIGPLVRAVEMNRFVRTIAILLKNHVPLLETIEVGRKVIQNPLIGESFANVSHELRSGAKLSDALRKSSYIPVDTIQLLKVGEESGNLGEVLAQAADEHENKLKVRIKRLLALFEPVVILLLASVILMVVISIFMAIFEMNEI